MSILDEILKRRPVKGTRIESPTNAEYEKLATQADQRFREKAIQSGLTTEKATKKLRTN